VVAAWFAGPSRFATPARRRLAPYLEANPVATYGVVVAILLLVFIWQPIPATGAPVGMIVFTVLALIGTEALRRQTRLEFRTAPRL
jgi:FtsH-binding integral membrane protein